MGDDLQKRLRRMGVVRGARDLKPARPDRESKLRLSRFADLTWSQQQDDGEIRPLDALLPGGRIVQNDAGGCFVIDRVYPLTYRHGSDLIGDICEMPLNSAAHFTGDDRLSGIDHRRLLFLDTETTGLAGAGTFAFMVGAAFFEPGTAAERDADVLVVRQYFLRDQADEPAMLLLLADLIDRTEVLVTFNGRSFDMPLLDNRYFMQRLDWRMGDLLEKPHIDLLHAARRLWRRRVGSCSLGSLEKNVLGLQRTEEDVPGWMIPGLYMDYLRSGDPRELLRIFYHNRVDMLSMVTLASRVARLFTNPYDEDYPEDLLSLASWHKALGLSETAEEILRLLAESEAELDVYQQALNELGLLLKRGERRDEAVNYWQQIAAIHIAGLTDERVALEAHIELAKHFEWQAQDLEAAEMWTRQALDLIDSWQSARAELVRPEIEHRLRRLESKRNAA